MANSNVHKINNRRNEKFSGMQSPPPPAWAESTVIYQVNTRQYTAEGTFNAFAAHLPELKELGVDILWFMPIHPIGMKNRKGSLGSPYSIRDYFAINQEFGTIEDFKKLVDKIHENGMHVIIDLVANHTAWDNPLIFEHADWYVHSKDGEIVSPNRHWPDVADLNYDKPELRRYMIGMMEWWIRETGIDGYRCDVAELVPGDFWDEAIAKLRKMKPIFMLAEGEAPELHTNGFNMTYASKMYRLFNRIAKGQAVASQIHKYLQSEWRRYPAGSMRMRFTSNHDENAYRGAAIERLGQGTKAFALLTFTLPGNPLIYNGQEAGISRKLKFYDKDQIEWSQSEFRSFYKTLIHLFKTHPALYDGAMQRINTQNDSEVYVFIRRKKEDEILVVSNLSKAGLTTKIDLTDITGNFSDIFRQTRLTLDNSELDMSLQPWEFRIYAKEL
ncbi:MAG: alpha-amylase [Actinobacteria bacterium]|nr:alpha-amylase [Actinomycetota bacterium]